MERLYSEVIRQHLKKYRQMVFLAGPRQVGKTTCSKKIAKTYPHFYYLNWESNSDRKRIIKGAEEVANYLNLNQMKDSKPVVVFDEIHKYRKWKYFLKGFFDLYESVCRIVVTGSSKLDVYRRGGDSLMGRYFPYHIHPLSIAELLNTQVRSKEIIPPKKITPKKLDHLFNFGGFPEPFIKAEKRFFNNWQRLRRQQLVQEDIRALTQIQDFAELDMLMEILQEESGRLLNISNLSNQLNVASTTIQRWVKTLEVFYYCFTIQPWSKNVRRSMRKTPKFYLWDWSMVKDRGQKVENFIASHLLKSVHYWTDLGFGNYGLFYLRDKQKREVDFLVTKDKKPWFLVEAKASSHDPLSKNLKYFSNELDIKHSFQLVFDMPYIDKDCFKLKKPTIVPASTFLSQLI